MQIYKKLLIMQLNKTRLILSLMVLCCAGAYIYTTRSAVDNKMKEIKVVESIVVKQTDIISTVKLIATITSKEQALLKAQEYGSIQIVLGSGTKVKKGDLIAFIENKNIEKNYKLMVDAEKIAKFQLERANKLFKTGVYSKVEFETIKNNYLMIQKQVADSKRDLDKLNFYSPIDGLVGPYRFKNGEQLQLNDKIVTVYNPDIVRVDFEIPFSVLASVNNGQQVKVFGKKYTIANIQKILNEETHSAPAYVELRCDNCVIGSTTEVKLDLVSHYGVVVVPSEAVFLKQGKDFVYVINQEKKLELRPIKLGIREKNMVEIESGLVSGEEIVSTSTARLYPGLAVKVYTDKKL